MRGILLTQDDRGSSEGEATAIDWCSCCQHSRCSTTSCAVTAVRIAVWCRDRFGYPSTSQQPAKVWDIVAQQTNVHVLEPTKMPEVVPL
jgi:hypothetical protein